MCKNAAFWCGMGAGLAVGAAGAMLCSRRCAMKTCVGRAIQRVGAAMDNAAEDLRQAIR